MKPEYMSLDGVRNPSEGLVNGGVEPCLLYYLNNQVDEELKKQDDRDTFAGFGFTIVPRPPFLPLKGRELLRQFGIAEGLL